MPRILKNQGNNSTSAASQKIVNKSATQRQLGHFCLTSYLAEEGNIKPADKADAVQSKKSSKKEVSTKAKVHTDPKLVLNSSKLKSNSAQQIQMKELNSKQILSQGYIANPSTHSIASLSHIKQYSNGGVQTLEEENSKVSDETNTNKSGQSSTDDESLGNRNNANASHMQANDEYSDFKVEPYNSQESGGDTDASESNVPQKRSTFKDCSCPEEIKICRCFNRNGKSQFLYRIQDFSGNWSTCKKFDTKKLDKFQKLLNVPDKYRNGEPNNNIYHDDTILEDLLFKNDDANKKRLKRKKVPKIKHIEENTEADRNLIVKPKQEAKTSYLKQIYYATKNVATNIQTKFTEKRNYIPASSSPLILELNSNIPEEQFKEPLGFPFIKYIELTKASNHMSFENNKDLNINENLSIKELSYFQTDSEKNKMSTNAGLPINAQDKHLVVMVASKRSKNSCKST